MLLLVPTSLFYTASTALPDSRDADANIIAV